MSNAQLAFLFSAETVHQSPLAGAASETSGQIEKVLDAFNGEPSLKRLFWELLSYGRVRDPLPLSILPPSAIKFVTSLEVFAESSASSIILAKVKYFPDGGQLEQMIWAVKRYIGNCIVLLTNTTTWQIIWPDETLKPRVRMMPLPGALHQRAEVVQALCGLNAADEDSGDEYTAFELAETLDGVFPGPTPNIGGLLTDFEWIAKHPNPEMQELLPFIRMAGQYPLLTAAQERGEDLTGNEIVPDGSGLPYHQWRLVVHNLRLVIWMAYKVPRIGLTLSDLVQEGSIGLMKAASIFDTTRGNRFTTLAYWWIRQNMLRELHNKCNLIRWPVYKAVKLMPALLKRKESGGSAGEKTLQSLEGGVQRRLWRLSFGACNPLDSVARRETSIAIQQALSELKPQQKEVISRRYGIENGSAETLECIGHDYGLTRERIRQIEEMALRRIKEHLSNQLWPYWIELEWRRSCAADDVSAQIQPPFRDFLHGLYDPNSES